MYAEYPLSGQDWILVYTSPPLSCSGINTLLQMFFVSRLPIVMGGSYSFAMPTISIILAGRYDMWEILTSLTHIGGWEDIPVQWMNQDYQEVNCLSICQLSEYIWHETDAD